MSFRTAYADVNISTATDWTTWTSGVANLKNDVTLTASTTLTGDATLNGNGKTVSGLNNNAAILLNDFSSNRELYLNNVTIDNCLSAMRQEESYYGDVALLTIQSDSGFTISNNFTTTEKTGGAFATLCSIVIQNVQGDLNFTNNSSHKRGGAIFSSNAVTINNVTKTVNFTKNTAISDDSDGTGGAIHSWQNVTIKNVGSLTFEENKSDYGGAIYAYPDSGNGVAITQNNGTVSFTGNTATQLGGAILSDQAPIAFSGDDSTFTFSGNKANGKSNDITVGADGSTISGKSTYSFGGGITGVNYDDEWNYIPAQFTLGISGGADVTFESGSSTDLGVLTVDAAKVKVDFSTTNGTTSFSTTGLTLQNAGEFSLQDGAITTLTISGPLTVTGGSKIDFDVLSATQYDAINADGEITFTDAVVFLNNTEGFEEGTTLDIAKSSTSVTEDGKTTVSFANSNYEYSVSTVDNGKTLRVTIGKEVPEPATWVLLALGMVGLMCGRRFRR